MAQHKYFISAYELAQKLCAIYGLQPGEVSHISMDIYSDDDIKIGMIKFDLIVTDEARDAILDHIREHSEQI